jgi:hypothetical protein
MTEPPQDKIMIHGPNKQDGSYLLELRKADGESMKISIPASEARVLKYFQAKMPNGIVVPDVEG